jgi:hypothetical protein
VGIRRVGRRTRRCRSTRRYRLERFGLVSRVGDSCHKSAENRRHTLSEILARCSTWLRFPSRLAPISALLPRKGSMVATCTYATNLRHRTLAACRTGFHDCDGSAFRAGLEGRRSRYREYRQGGRHRPARKAPRPFGLCPERAHASLLVLPVSAILDCAERLPCARSGHKAAREIQSDRRLGGRYAPPRMLREDEP